MWFLRSSCTVVALAASVVACSASDGGRDTDDSDAGDTDVAVASLSGTIGPAGGEIVGDAAGPFAGVHLVVPAGALTDETTIEITGVVDPTPLPEDAERVGPQLHLEPEGLAFAVPAELTVPFDPALRGLWPIADEDCRVWYRDGEGWSRADAVRADASGITVSVAVLANVGAGVSLSNLTLNGSCLTCALSATTCASGASFCVTPATAAMTAVPYDYTSMTTVGPYLYFLTSPTANTFTIGRYDVKTGETRLANSLSGTPTRTVSSVGRIAVTPSGEMWIALNGYGDVRFQFGTAPILYDRDLALAGVVMAEGGTTPFRLTYRPEPRGNFLESIEGFSLGGTRLHTLLQTERGESNELRVYPPVCREIVGTGGVFTADFAFTTSASDPVADLWSGVYGEPSGVYDRMVMVSGPGRRDETGLRVIADCTTAGYPLYDFRNDQVARVCGGGTARMDHERSPDLNPLSIAWIPGDRSRVAYPPAFLTSPTELVLDGHDDIFIASASRAEVERYDASGGVASFALTSATPGSKEYQAAMVRALRYNDSLDALVLVTRGTTGTLPRVWTVTNYR